jgi:uncharacterized protein (TIGR01777 family)
VARRVVVAGGSGFLGRSLCRYLVELGYDVVVLTRAVRDWGAGNCSVRQVLWDGRSVGLWGDEVDGSFAVINLAGENVASGRWGRRKKRRILDSRIAACDAVVEAVAAAKEKPVVVIQASAIGYYGDRGDEVVDETSSKGGGFLAEVVERWEAAVAPVGELGVRLVTLRLGVVLGRGGGMMAKVVTPFRFFVGGHLGSGRQWMSWVHVDDVLGTIGFCLERESVEEVFNLVAPESVRAKDFFATLGQVMGRPSWLHVPGFVLKVLLGDMAREMLLAGQRVAAKRLIVGGYVLKYSRLDGALEDIFQRAV